MIFDQKSQFQAVLEQNRPLRPRRWLPDEDFALLNHSTFKPFERYSDRLLVQITRWATLPAVLDFDLNASPVGS